MSYGFTVTAAGLNYLMNLQVSETMVIDSIVVGDGVLADGTPPQSLTDLVHPMYYATSTVPIVTDNILRMTIEFRNRMEHLRPDLPVQEVSDNFWLSECGVFVRNGAGKRILLYYGNLSAFPEPVIAFNPNRPFILVKRYPVEIVLLQGEVTINLDYASAVFVTHPELATAIEPFHSHIRDYNNPHRTTAEQIGAVSADNIDAINDNLDYLENLSIINSIRTNRENDEVVTRTGDITAASGTIVFKTPFDIVPKVFIPQGGTVTPANVTKTQFIYSGSAAGRFWVAVADNS